MKSFLVVVVLIVTGCSTKKAPEKEQDFIQKANKLVLSEKNQGIEYFFKILLKKEVREYRITYLGNIKTKKGEILKFLNSTAYTGVYEDSKHASSTVDVYTDNDKYIGSYEIGDVSDLPDKVENGKLIFSYNNEHCNERTEISFLDSIPHSIFIKCKGDSGDLYSLTTDDNPTAE